MQNQQSGSILKRMNTREHQKVRKIMEDNQRRWSQNSLCGKEEKNQNIYPSKEHSQWGMSIIIQGLQQGAIH